MIGSHSAESVLHRGWSVQTVLAAYAQFTPTAQGDAMQSGSVNWPLIRCRAVRIVS